MRAVIALLMVVISGTALAASLESKLPVKAEATAFANAQLLADTMGGKLLSVANTHSMEPVLTSSDLVVIEAVNLADLRVGDVVVFQRRAHYFRSQFLQGGLVCHRVIEIRDGYVITQGDNSEAADDDNVTQRSLRGRIAYAIDGQSGSVRDLRVTREGEALTDLQALNRELQARQ